jgi:hypothetical protein
LSLISFVSSFLYGRRSRFDALKLRRFAFHHRAAGIVAESPVRLGVAGDGEPGLSAQEWRPEKGWLIQLCE